MISKTPYSGFLLTVFSHSVLTIRVVVFSGEEPIYLLPIDNLHTSKKEMVEQTGKQDADKENGSFLDTALAEPFDTVDFNGKGPTNQVNLNFKK